MQGVPEVIEGDPHTRSVEILWLTSAVCKPGSNLLVENETKCYLVNHNNNNGLQATFVDLSGLIQKRGYIATTTSYPSLVLNVSVCRPMSTNGPCDGSMVCMYHNDSKLTLPGGWNSPVPIATLQKSSLTQATPHYESGDIVVTYPITAPGITSTYCDNTSPFVKIRFKCPTGDEVSTTFVHIWIIHCIHTAYICSYSNMYLHVYDCTCVPLNYILLFIILT